MAVQSFLTVVADTTGSTTSVELVNPSIDYALVSFDTAQLTGDVYITYATTPLLGQLYHVYIATGGLDLNGFELKVFGLPITQETLNTYTLLKLNLQYLQPTVIGGFPIVYAWYDEAIDSVTPDGSILFSKLESLATNKTLVGNGSNVAVADYIKNANIDASAGIARTKIASGTASRVVVNDGAGALAELAQLTPALGGTGIDSSSSTGFAVVSSGTHSVGALTETIRVDVSFVTASQGTYYVALPACTVTKVKARVTSAIAGTDDATITCQNASSTNMTGGLITIPASSAHGTGVSVTPSANNTFTAGQEMQLVVAKVTQGGVCSVDITFTRTALT